MGHRSEVGGMGGYSLMTPSDACVLLFVLLSEDSTEEAKLF